MALKHVIVERPKPDRVDEFTALGEELMALMLERGWYRYTARVAISGDEGDPPLFDIGILGRPVAPEGPVFVFDCDFPDLAALEDQLRTMRNDPDVLRILLRAPELVDQAQSRAYILEEWSRAE